MLIVGIGGTVSPVSSSDQALRTTMTEISRLGADTRLFTGEFLKALPTYDPTAPARTAAAADFVGELRRASGIVLSGAAYHGTVSGMFKNALDYTEDLALDSPPYFSGRPVGCIAVAKGWQAGVGTLTTLRSIVHALRGWPTPYGCVVNTSPGAGPGSGLDGARDGLCLLAGELYQAAQLFDSRATVAAK
ncbi:NADPH-dependent FMN reductase [Micromonospora radicis]|uniref:FMN reductase n=1 Tax=Micromonospora radicis TaxID=1894971 RepID=A0A418MXG4_9ACTN|nr:NAD(P)H-dependent oxidoreductase [Micromonospora radicis]RIV39224.1 FMN reductase [Micromonospora radicis]